MNVTGGEMPGPAAGGPLVLMETSSGEILLELYPDKAPLTVANFLRYVDGDFYRNTIFHRVIRDFMIQGGGLTPRLEEKPAAAPVPNEADNGLSNRRGALAMARTTAPHSATCQFFINTADNPELDFTAATEAGYGYCVFGSVAEGMEVVDAIAKTRVSPRGGHEAVPVDSVIILSMSRFEL
ncbi:MAG: peptidyl-prolyl cis-trans isomerase [Desulfovibrio sp.]|jgi:peptidyl-prolyl cis-trans isomerase B (cyclophilin B)|nr:peptidyl-prolyl cis-trans isomerase [Desulfovibrio sp.]